MLAQVLDRGQDPKAGSDRAFGVVAVGHRRAEHRHHRVPDELLQRSAVRLDLLAGHRVVARQRVADVLGIRVVGGRRKAFEVDEEDRDELPLLARAGARAERRSARGAEPSPARSAAPAALAVLRRLGRGYVHLTP